MTIKWLIESKFATESGYPNKIELDSLAILSGRQDYPLEQCILRSSIGAMRDVERRCKLNIKMFPGYKKDSFDCNQFMESFGQDALNYEHVYMTWGQIWKQFNHNSEVFIRPVYGFKTFAGGLLSKERMYDRLIEEKIPYSTLCLVSPAKPIEAEYRLVVAGQNIIGATLYLPDESPKVPQSILSAGREFLTWIDTPDDIYCLDLCVSDGKIKLLEINSFTTSGLYCVNIPEMCEQVEKFLIEKEKEYD